MSISKTLYNFFYPSQSYDLLHKKDDDDAREKLELQLKQLQKYDQIHSLTDTEIEELSYKIVQDLVKLPLETIDAEDLGKVESEIIRLSKQSIRFREKTMSTLFRTKPKNNLLKEKIIIELADKLIFVYSKKY